MKELIGQQAPEWDVTTLEEQPVKLSQLRGAPVLLMFWKSTCPWCAVEMPRLAEVIRRHDTVDVKVLGLAVGGDTVETARRFVAEKGLDLPHAVDEGDMIARAYGVERVPSVAVIDGAGILQRTYEGATEQLPGIVEQALMAVARGDELPDYDLIGNGCAA